MRACSHHKLLLCASHAGASLCVLMCSDQQLNQSGDGSLLPQRSMVCRAQSQVTDQTHCSLMDEDISTSVTSVTTFYHLTSPVKALSDLMTNAYFLCPSVQIH